mmetsp:Transcript_6113/g.12849  ORF Transcript_6113/g.12849 Transcript_6113/m.12849 type:complete len:207 (+) Transcript_6113:177-797(+)
MRRSSPLSSTFTHAPRGSPSPVPLPPSPWHSPRAVSAMALDSLLPPWSKTSSMASSLSGEGPDPTILSSQNSRPAFMWYLALSLERYFFMTSSSRTRAVSDTWKHACTSTLAVSFSTPTRGLATTKFPERFPSLPVANATSSVDMVPTLSNLVTTDSHAARGTCLRTSCVRPLPSSATWLSHSVFHSYRVSPHSLNASGTYIGGSS